MRYDILYPEAFPIVRCHLRKGEAVKAASDAMISMSTTIRLRGRVEGGFLSGLVRKYLTHESFFLQTLTAEHGDGDVLLGHPLPGGIEAVTLDGTDGLMVQKGGFLAASAGVRIRSRMQSVSRGLFSGEGFFLLHLTGKGVAFLGCYGRIHAIRLAQGEERIIDNGHLVAWPDSMRYSIEKAAGIFSSYTSGEGIVCRFRGPGTVLIQTRNPASFRQFIRNSIK